MQYGGKILQLDYFWKMFSPTYIESELCSSIADSTSTCVLQSVTLLCKGPDRFLSHQHFLPSGMITRFSEKYAQLWKLSSLLSPQILWTFSIYLESVAILPQLFMISKTGEAETITTHYLFFLGLYRALYLINWIWRFYFEGFFDMIAIVAGVVQTILYCDFFYLYVTKGEWCIS